MGERTFTVRGTRYLREELEATVTAESFDEATNKFYHQEWDDYQVVDSEYGDLDRDETQCDECGAYSEDACDCGHTDPSELNPDFGLGRSVHEFYGNENMWIQAVDLYTKHTIGEEPVKVLNVCDDEYDDDDEIRMEWEDADGDTYSEYLHRACQFKVVPAPKPLTPEEREERERADREEKERRRAKIREQMALEELLRV